MFLRIDELSDDETIAADLCIVGAGAAGIAMARKLRDTPLSIVMIESGDFDLESDIQELAEGAVAGLDYPALDGVRLRVFGGTTGHWAGQSTPLDPIDFAVRDWVPDSGWPIGYQDFASYLREAAEVCRLTMPAAAVDPWALSDPLPEFPLAGTGYEPEVFRFPEPVTRFGEVYRGDIEKAANVRCIVRCNLVGFETDEARGRITGARVASIGGKRARIAARHYVLAAGGIENARILLIAKLGDPASQESTGRYFMEHPNFGAGRVVFSPSANVPYFAKPRARRGDQEVRLDFRLSDARQREAGILNHSAFLIPRRDEESEGGALMRLWNRVGDWFDDEDARPASYQLRIRLEQAPNPESRVTLADEVDALGLPRARLALRFGDLEGRTLATVFESFAAAVGTKNYARMQIDFDAENLRWQQQVGWQIHHCGGTRMHDDPRKGVVDRDCRMHGVSNLSIAGSSVFPTAGHANPTMNLIALALRLTDDLRQELT
ncbi:GMC oxidoreductase [Pelagibius sp.]|uniref:GMC oxidoreductase n=1 Tax=Pelagibius sp. TaxID=1931238 RepID=UPI003B50E5E1